MTLLLGKAEAPHVLLTLCAPERWIFSIVRAKHLSVHDALACDSVRSNIVYFNGGICFTGHWYSMSVTLLTQTCLLTHLFTRANYFKASCGSHTHPYWASI